MYRRGKVTDGNLRSVKKKKKQPLADRRLAGCPEGLPADRGRHKDTPTPL